MDESTLLLALVLGAICAASLALGSLTTTVRSPTDRAAAVLTAFGGGALLAALTLGMVGVALSRGHTVPLVLGSILGGRLFIALKRDRERLRWLPPQGVHRVLPPAPP